MKTPTNRGYGQMINTGQTLRGQTSYSSVVRVGAVSALTVCIPLWSEPLMGLDFLQLNIDSMGTLSLMTIGLSKA
jgi:hypothetical protein